MSDIVIVGTLGKLTHVLLAVAIFLVWLVISFVLLLTTVINVSQSEGTELYSLLG